MAPAWAACALVIAAALAPAQAKPPTAAHASSESSGAAPVAAEAELGASRESAAPVAAESELGASRENVASPAADPAAPRPGELIPFQHMCPASTSSAADSLELALVASAIGLERLSAGDAAAAVGCLELAKLALPTSSVIARDLAGAYLASGALEQALAEVDASITLGDSDPEAKELRAVILARLGRTNEAADSARDADTWRGDLLAASLGDGTAAYRVSEVAAEQTSRGALTSLVLASYAGSRGEENVAQLLLEGVELLASRVDTPDIHAAARTLGETLDARRGPRAAARVRVAIEHATNPAFLYAPPRVDHTGVRFALLAETGLHAPIAAARFNAALRIDQHVFITQRDAFRDLDLFGVTLAASVDLPISRHPSAALVGLRARYTDTFGNRFRVHYASTIEGGPNLVLPMSSALRAELGFYGIATDYIDRSPADAQISSLNRDLFGQRAVFTLAFATEWLEGRADAMFLRDDALGDAFDALGGALGVRLAARPSEGVVLSTGAGVDIRDYGPVGDLAIIGPAATRVEVRTAIELGAKIELSEALWFVVEDLWVQNNARNLHSYTENVLTVGVEQTW